MPPAAGSAVIATGIVSVGLHLTGQEVLSYLLLALAAGLWVLLAAAFALTGDQWVIAGALSISALAAGKLTALPDWTPGLHGVLRITTWVLLGLALTGYAVLLAAELRSPRPAYDVRRWATVFPLGMTAVATLIAATATKVDWLRPFGRVLLWIAAGAWLLTAVGFLVAASRWPRVRRLLRRVR
ncbi:hypothetical protein ACIRRH_28230 [Kitasatospora sp. NPDC101235]|uniref:SLAC1 family transporter n=1 Tax=Kitasatospora sp. NPDC101235 TaxID=3364101 RepID=UPI003824CB19